MHGGPSVKQVELARPRLIRWLIFRYRMKAGRFERFAEQLDLAGGRIERQLQTFLFAHRHTLAQHHAGLAQFITVIASRFHSLFGVLGTVLPGEVIL